VFVGKSIAQSSAHDSWLTRELLINQATNMWIAYLSINILNNSIKTT